MNLALPVAVIVVDYQRREQLKACPLAHAVLHIIIPVRIRMEQNSCNTEAYIDNI